MLRIQKLFQCIFLLVIGGGVMAQEEWPSPEVAQMYRQSQDYVKRGNYTDAAITLKHAISLAPQKMVLYRELANAYYLAADYKEAEQALSSINQMPDADARCFRLLAASEAAAGNDKEAFATIKKGLGRFPSAGELYYQKGLLLRQKRDPEGALAAWLDGIGKEPGYAANYYEAATSYLDSENPLWGLLYGEIYLNLTIDTLNSGQLKHKLLSGYKKMFDRIGNKVPEYGKARPSKTPENFASVVTEIYSGLTPVVSDGITTENLTMVRTRFIMEWFSRYSDHYPFRLFSYMDELIKNGRFDVYNEWLFGAAESPEEFKAWNTFHTGDMERFIDWGSKHRINISSNEHYQPENNLK